jgi:hypothetical protein
MQEHIMFNKHLMHMQSPTTNRSRHRRRLAGLEGGIKHSGNT